MKEYILNDLEVLTPESLVNKAQEIFETLPITHLPIVKNEELIGSISESDLHTIDEKSSKISEYSHLTDFFFIDENISLLKTIKLFSEHDTNIMPVLNDKKKYIGYYELHDVLELFCSNSSLFSDGVMIVIEKNKKDFSVSEVSQIVESNNATILALYISNQTSDAIQVTVKINSEDINEVIQTFRRYNYNLISEHKDDFYLQDLKDRSDYLQKYLDM